MDEPSPPPRIAAWNRAYWVATIWLIGWMGIIAKQVVSQRNPIAGMQEGAVIGAFTSPFMLIVTLPLGLLGAKLAGWQPLRRYKLWLSLFLPFLFSFMDAASFAVERVYPQRRFQRFTGVRFPEGAKIEHCWVEGTSTPISDRLYTFQFTCSPGETDRLIHEMKLSKVHGGSTIGGSPGPGSIVIGGGWQIEESWSADDGVGNADFLELQTDATRTRVCIIAGTI